MTPAPRRWLRRLVLLTLLVAVAAVALVAFAPQIVARTSLKDRVLAAATADLDGTLTVDDLSLDWWSPVVASGVTLTGPDGQVAATAPTVATSRTLLSLALDRADLGTVTVTGATVYVRCEPGKTNLETVLAKYLKADPGKPPSPRPALAVEVNDATVSLSESGSDAVQTLKPVSAVVTLSPAAATEVKYAVGEELRGTVSAGDAVVAHADATGFPLDAVGPLLRRFVPRAAASGLLTGVVDVNAAAAEVTVAGHAEAANFAVAGPLLNGERVALTKLTVAPTEVHYKAGELRVSNLDVSCDAGKVSASGVVSLDGPPEDALQRAGLKLHADFDLAKLAAVAPRALRLRPGTALTAGSVSLKLDSAASETHAEQTAWTGSLTTTALRGTRGGQPLAWEKPLHADFTAHLDKKFRPTFDALKCEADFVGLAARGSAEEFLVMANLDLARLAAHLGDFVDLNGQTFGGTAVVSLKNDPRPGGGFLTAGSATVERAHYADGKGRTLSEPRLAATLTASGAVTKAGTLAIDAAELKLDTGGDRLSAKLTAPIPDALKPRAGRADVTLTGDLARWRGRVAPWAGVPADWVIAGQADAAATVAASATGATLTAGRADVAAARFAGLGLNFTEPTLKLLTNAAWDRATDAVTLTDVTAHCETFVLTTPRLTVLPSYAVSTDAKLTANVNRLQKALGLQGDRAGSDAVNGLAVGPVSLSSPDGHAVDFAADLKVTDLIVGPPADPAWREPRVNLKAKGRYADNAVTLTSATAERDGLTATGSGSLTHLSSTLDLAVKGDLTYDLAKLGPQLQPYLGTDGKATGTGTRPFEFRGPLSGPGGALANLAGHAGVSWQDLEAYGFTVGPGELTATLDRGLLTTNPVTANFGGGKVTVEPTVNLRAASPELSVKPGRVIDHTKLTPKALSQAVGFALPAFAGATRADGTFSLDIADSRVPLAAPERGTVKGTLTVHEANVSPGPVITEVAKLMGAEQTSLTLAKEEVVPVKLENGRVYHEKFKVLLGRTDVVTSGSVGLDKSLDLMLDLPIPPKLLEQTLKNRPHLREALLKQRLQVPVRGTLDKPQIDATKFNGSVAALLRDAGMDAAKDALREKLTGGKLFDELFKKKPPE
jgi:translocation and assembly module TamB